jgi:hypothetical protein
MDWFSPLFIPEFWYKRCLLSCQSVEFDKPETLDLLT